MDNFSLEIESIDERNSLRDFIKYDFTSKYAADEYSLKQQQERMEAQMKKENEKLHERHKREQIDVWDSI